LKLVENLDILRYLQVKQKGINMTSEEDIELYRLEAVGSLPEIYFEDTLENVKKNFNTELNRHEAMDRSFMISDNIEDFLVDHPYIILRPECYRLAFKAQELLQVLYQKVGNSNYNV